MNKTITLITGAIAIIVLTVFLILNKIDLTTFGTLTTTILGFVYGFYQKVENNELIKSLDFKSRHIKQGQEHLNSVTVKYNKLTSRFEESKKELFDLESQKQINLDTIKRLNNEIIIALKSQVINNTTIVRPKPVKKPKV